MLYYILYIIWISMSNIWEMRWEIRWELDEQFDEFN